METAGGNLSAVANLIQLAVAPIFLLTAVATTLMVLIGRLARIVDRGRILEARASSDAERQNEELLVIERRAHLIYRALTLGVLAAILVCLLMAIAFAGELFNFRAAGAVAVLFLSALLAYTGALMCLLREVFLAIGNFSLRLHDAAAGK